ncbi:MAG: lipid-A-disaccharide synthase, partial [Saprospiraceae bacterium]|nr:lipid-A-disaccharide synthase [Saprospiraceae bacterium]
MRYYLIAGEASGDLHGSNLMNALKMADKSAEFRFWGGDRMKSIADQLVKHYRDTAYMGFLEVVKNLPSIFKNLTRCKKDILTYQPDALILIDYPGFNMRIAKWAHDQGLKVFYYIAPQVWAWKAQRAHKLKHIVDALYVILPFEKNFFEKYDFQVKYVGHPLLDAISDMNIDPNSFRRSYNLNDKPILALLPGSRLQEIDMALPIMLRAVSEISNYQIIIAGLSAIDTQVYDHHITTTQVGKVIMDQTHALLDQASLALVSSGTATLEAALFDVPQI